MQCRERAVNIQVIWLDIRHDGQVRAVFQEGAVVLIGFHHEILAFARRRIGAEIDGVSADHESGGETVPAKHAGYKRGRGALAVAAGDGDNLLPRHQAGNHLRPLQRLDAESPRFGDLRVVLARRGCVDNQLGVADVAGVVTLVDGDA